MDDTSIDRAKTHIKKYKTTYLIAGSLVLGVIIGRAYLPRIITINNAVSPIFNNAPTFTNSPVINNANLGGHAHKLVKCLDTGQIWETVKDAADAAGVTPSMMSRHINGHRDHISDLHYAIIGLGTGV